MATLFPPFRIRTNLFTFSSFSRLPATDPAKLMGFCPCHSAATGASFLPNTNSHNFTLNYVSSQDHGLLLLLTRSYPCFKGTTSTDSVLPVLLGPFLVLSPNPLFSQDPGYGSFHKLIIFFDDIRNHHYARQKLSKSVVINYVLLSFLPPFLSSSFSSFLSLSPPFLPLSFLSNLSMLDTQRYTSFRYTTQWLNDSVCYAMLTPRVATIWK